MDFSKLKLSLLVLLLFLSALPMSHAVISIQMPEANSSEITQVSFEKHLGRKLTFSEKIAFKIFNKKIKKIARSQKKRRKFKANDCAKIALKNGEVLEVELIQISPTEVKYKPCNKAEALEFVLNKKDIFSIQSSNGEILYTSNNPTEKIADDAKELEKTESLNKDKNRKTDGLAIASLVLSIIGLVLFSFSILALISTVLAIGFGLMSQRKIKQNPKLYKGKSIALVGIIISGLICFYYFSIGFLIPIFL